MRQVLIVLGLLAFSPAGRGTSAVIPDNSPQPPIPQGCRQLLVVRTPTWSSIGGTLQRYERSGAQDWQRVGSATPLNVGRNGMGWGRGLFKGKRPGPIKREGDGRSPAGAFALGRAFGAADTLPEGSQDFPYLHTLPSTYCVEDMHSKFYNQIIDSPGVTPGSRPGWSELQRTDGLFRWGIIVRQNDEETRAGAGSCVFLHIWRAAGRGTAGCTAMPSNALETTLRWLDPAAGPVLIELPDSAFEELREAWALPAESQE